MNASLKEPPEETSASEIRTVGDLHPLVVARLVAEWARIDREFPMRRFGEEMLGRHVTLGLDRWFVGRRDKGPTTSFTVTREIEGYGANLGQQSWEIQMDDLRRNGCKARMEPI